MNEYIKRIRLQLYRLIKYQLNKNLKHIYISSIHHLSSITLCCKYCGQSINEPNGIECYGKLKHKRNSKENNNELYQNE